MKVLRLTTLLDFGGQERKYISFTENSLLHTNQYIFAAIGYGGHAEKVLKNRGFVVKIFNSNPKITNLKNIWLLYKWIKKIKPDVVHTAAAEANFHGTIAAKLAGVKIIFAEEIGIPSHSNNAKKIFKIVYKLCDKVVCVSKAVKEQLISINEIENHKGIVIYNPVSDKYNCDLDENLSLFTLISVGRLEKIKNQAILVQAFAELNLPNSQLILVGEGRERQNIEKLILNYKIDNKVTLVGFSSTPEKYLKNASVFILPSFSEGFGIAAVEAMKMGLPCICCNVGGIPEFIEENKTGWLFDPTNCDELKQKINFVYHLAYEQQKKVGNNGKNYVEHIFSERNYVKNLEFMYQKKYDKIITHS
jgi:glycosyltransferase involved in cell wall biosynthesis